MPRRGNNAAKRPSATATTPVGQARQARECSEISRSTVPAPADIFNKETVRPASAEDAALRDSGVIPKAPKVPEFQLDPLELDLGELSDEEWELATKELDECGSKPLWEEVSAVRQAYQPAQPAEFQAPTVSGEALAGETSGVRSLSAMQEQVEVAEIDDGW